MYPFSWKDKKLMCIEKNTDLYHNLKSYYNQSKLEIIFPILNVIDTYFNIELSTTGISISIASLLSDINSNQICTEFVLIQNDNIFYDQKCNYNYNQPQRFFSLNEIINEINRLYYYYVYFR